MSVIYIPMASVFGDSPEYHHGAKSLLTASGDDSMWQNGISPNMDNVIIPSTHYHPVTLSPRE